MKQHDSHGLQETRRFSRGPALALACALPLAIGACEGDSGDGPGGAAFDAGAFDGGSTPGIDGSTTSDGAAPGDGAAADGGVVTPPAPTPNDVYVDPANGVDTNTGKVGSPFKSLAKAFSVVPAGAGVHLLDGTYDAANEGGATAATIPADVNVRSENPGKAILTGMFLRTTGGATALYGLAFGANVRVDARGTTKLLGANLVFTPNGFEALAATDGADVTLVGGSLDGQGTGTPIGGTALLHLNGTGTLTLDGFTMKNTKSPGVRVDGPAAATKAKLVVKSTQFDGVGSTYSSSCSSIATIIGGQYATILVDGSTLKGAVRGTGICIAKGVDVTVQNGTAISGEYLAVSADPAFIVTNDASVKVRDATFTNNYVGVGWRAPGAVDVADSTFTTTPVPAIGTVGIWLEAGAPALTGLVRNTKISGHARGILVGKAPTTIATISADLGTAGSPGNNTLTGNVESALRCELGAGENVNAAGNTWNASVQDADGAGHYAAGTVETGPQNAPPITNFYLGAASTITF